MVVRVYSPVVFFGGPLHLISDRIRLVDCKGSEEQPGTTHHPDGSETEMLVVEDFPLASPS